MLICRHIVRRAPVYASALFFLITAIAVGPGRLDAQGATASIQGTVTDASGAGIPEAAVQVKNTGTGLEQTTTSDASGRFTVRDLPVGTYDVQAGKAGFSTVVHRGVTLTVGSQTVVDFSLAVGQQQQTITVEGEVSQVETTNATVGVLTDQHQMRDLPLNGRNFEQLIQLTPGVNQVGGNAFLSSGFQGRAPEYSIAGSRPIGQAILLDDENLQNFWNKGMGSVIGSSLGVEAIGEFQTLTNTYSAQFGGNGGVINAVSKSGTNAFHGSAYEFFRNDVLDARSFIDPSTKPAYRQNQFGGSLGGPVKKDKAFFFVNYEGIRLAQGETKLGTVPGCNLIPANCVPQATNPQTAQAIANTLKMWSNATTIINGQPEALTVANRTATENYVLARFDYNLSAKDSLLVRYISDKSDFLEPFGGGGFAGGAVAPYWPEQDYSKTQFSTLEWRRLVSSSVINVARFSFSRPATNEFTAPTPASALPNGQDPLQFFGPAGGRQDGIVNITGLTGIGGALQLPFNTTQNRYTEGDDVTWTHGAVNVRMGASVERLQSNTFMPFFDGSQWNFTGLSTGPFPFLRGVPSILLYVPQGSYPNRDFRNTLITPYGQVDWKVSSKLTLNIGLRWEFVTNPVDKHDQLYYVPNIATAVRPFYQHLTNAMANNPAWRNWDPRFGFAYSPFGDQKTSIRGGFGIFHEPIGINNIAPGFWAAQPWAINGLPGALGAQYPNIPAPGAINVAKPSSTPGWDYYADSTPYVMQYNLNVQRELVTGTVLTVGYVGSRGLHLLTSHEANPPLVCSFAQGPGCANPSAANGPAGGYLGFGTPGNVTSNPNLNNGLGSFPNLTPEAWLRYNSLLTSVNRRLTKNVQALVSYTWSRCIDNGGYLGSFNSNSNGAFTNPYNLNSDKAVCSYDQTHVFKVNGLVTLPFQGNALIKGWQISGILATNSGLPVNIQDGYDEAAGGTPVALTPRPDYVPGCQVQVNKVNQWYNPQCFTLEAPGTFGNLGRNIVRGPRFFNTDIALLKDTKVTEKLNAQFRAEFFNILNHTNLGLPSTGIGGGSLFLGGGTRNPAAGQITTFSGPPRQIQFALKFLF
ncbi:MAG TPA: carboxypeptidase regulatory-like domain-containing protein [Bryobacteraceae bacterium]|nr:carboxypeptidase regulatory-like domain-containing protein [Bryobacteraceae bacterium]